ncbi:MAG: zinc ribbon domain-containing protein [Ignavibacteriales bacterium]|nr:zinc ribbon domain-containing protein [Ignavibacteriales bacterium]
MPTYEYKCLKCGNRFEIFQSMKDEPTKNCPVCNGEVKRLISAGAGAIFKGTGFYHTDYKNSSKPSETKTAEKVKPVEKSTTEIKTVKKNTADK